MSGILDHSSLDAIVADIERHRNSFLRLRRVGTLRDADDSMRRRLDDNLKGVFS